jgi:hypothetical protein
MQASNSEATASIGQQSGVQPIESAARTTFTSTIRLRLRAPAKLRNLELVLLLIACVIVGGSLALVQLGALGHIDPTILIIGSSLGVLAIAMHVVMRFVASEADPFILPVITVLNGLGIAEIYRLDIATKASGWESSGVRQIAWTAMAMLIAIAVILLIRNHRVLQRYRYVAMFVGIALLLLPMLPVIGETVNGARLWIRIGAFNFQPGELAKIALAVFFAGYLVTAREPGTSDPSSSSGSQR